MIITRVEPLTKTKFRIYIDGEPVFVLYRGELKRFNIAEEEEISEQTVEKINKDVLLKRAKLRAMHLLEDMDRTEKALRDKLRQGGYPESAIDGAVKYVSSFGYLNDVRFAENFVLSRKNSKSRREIQALLAQKGVPADTAQAVLEQIYGEDGEQASIRQILRKKRMDPERADEQTLRKIYGYLARKGYRYEDIRQVIQNDYPNA
ncbi:MAG TPA: recombination regulator RecX [Candidatus Mediterraneibacter stercoripullorum]|nr:recombination regulator RecX [Candidatus Mediterraneibacter stercoripullorum]